jgi:hypothetical protein
MSREQLKQEIQRVKVALCKTNSPKLKRDYTKYLYKLQRKLKEAENVY